MRNKYQRNKLGNVYAIPLPNGKFGFCRSFREGSIAVYRHIGDSIDDLPKSEEYQFTIGVDKWVLTCCDWPIVENRPFNNEDDSWPPPEYFWDDASGKYSQYHKGQSAPSTKAACQGLEFVASWGARHVIERIMGDDEWRQFSYEQSYIDRYGQEAFDELTKDS